MGERKPNNYASQLLLFIFVAGAFATAFALGDAKAPFWERVWKTGLWPYYITYTETYRYFYDRESLPSPNPKAD